MFTPASFDLGCVRLDPRQGGRPPRQRRDFDTPATWQKNGPKGTKTRRIGLKLGGPRLWDPTDPVPGGLAVLAKNRAGSGYSMWSVSVHCGTMAWRAGLRGRTNLNQVWVCRVFVCQWTPACAGPRTGVLTHTRAPCGRILAWLLSVNWLKHQHVELSNCPTVGASTCPRAACVLACVRASLRAAFTALWPSGRALSVVRPKPKTEKKTYIPPTLFSAAQGLCRGPWWICCGLAGEGEEEAWGTEADRLPATPWPCRAIFLTVSPAFGI